MADGQEAAAGAAVAGLEPPPAILPPDPPDSRPETLREPSSGHGAAAAAEQACRTAAAGAAQRVLPGRVRGGGRGGGVVEGAQRRGQGRGGGAAVTGQGPPPPAPPPGRGRGRGAAAHLVQAARPRLGARGQLGVARPGGHPGASSPGAQPDVHPDLCSDGEGQPGADVSSGATAARVPSCGRSSAAATSIEQDGVDSDHNNVLDDFKLEVKLLGNRKKCRREFSCYSFDMVVDSDKANYMDLHKSVVDKYPPAYLEVAHFHKSCDDSTPETSKSHSLEVSSTKKGNRTNSNSGRLRLSRSGSNQPEALSIARIEDRLVQVKKKRTAINNKLGLPKKKAVHNPEVPPDSPSDGYKKQEKTS